MLLILRRGRLFSISLSGKHAHVVDAINAYPDGATPKDVWVDEMLVVGRRAILVGFDRRLCANTVSRVRIGAGGRLAFEDSYQFRGVTRTSPYEIPPRLIYGKLVLYSQTGLDTNDPIASYPAMRRFGAKDFGAVASARDLYVAPRLLSYQVKYLHTLTMCDVALRTVRCHATGVLGGEGQVHMSKRAAYLWIADWYGPNAFVYRMPLDGDAPRAVRAIGSPVAFRADDASGSLDVVIEPQFGHAGWAPNLDFQAIGLLTIPASAFGDGSGEMAPKDYRTLATDGPAFAARLSGDRFLYADNLLGEHTVLHAVSLRDGKKSDLPVGFGVNTFEPIGGDVMAIGRNIVDEGSGQAYFESDTHLAAFRLDGTLAAGGHYLLPASNSVEHIEPGFFFDAASSVIGLPVGRHLDPNASYKFDGSATVTFLSYRDGALQVLGEVGSPGADLNSDNCHSACTDWYGDTRPIFVDGRVFALMGYELAELDPQTMRERTRLNFTPH